jgi:hypothetical protein
MLECYLVVDLPEVHHVDVRRFQLYFAVVVFERDILSVVLRLVLVSFMFLR